MSDISWILEFDIGKYKFLEPIFKFPDKMIKIQIGTSPINLI